MSTCTGSGPLRVSGDRSEHPFRIAGILTSNGGALSSLKPPDLGVDLRTSLWGVLRPRIRRQRVARVWTTCFR